MRGNLGAKAILGKERCLARRLVAASRRRVQASREVSEPLKTVNMQDVLPAGEARMVSVLRKLALLLALLAASTDAMAQSWPARPLRVIVSQAAGGTPDIICRMVMERLSRALASRSWLRTAPAAAT